MKRRARSGNTLQLVGALLLVLLLGCSQDAESPQAVEATPSQQMEPMDFLDMFTGYAADEDLAASPSELASWSEIVVSGRLSEILPGRELGTVGYPELPTEPRLLMRVEVETVHIGAFHDKFIFVELPAPGRLPAQVFNDAAPDNAPVILYLTRYRPDSPGDSDFVIDHGPAWPGDLRVFEPTTSQGFIIDQGHVGMPLDEGRALDATSLTDFLPKRHRWGGGQLDR